MRCEAQDGPCSSATQAACNEAARPNPTGEIGELISYHIHSLAKFKTAIQTTALHCGATAAFRNDTANPTPLNDP